MSLHALANHMATKGRNGDSMLVHMTPGEVAGLHALALKHGGELTINPDTGLPEASFLKSLLPMLAGAALNFFVPGLGAAVGGAFGVGAAAGTGIAVGGITGLATGSLSRGLMAGLGAYGGAGLVEGITGLGAGELAQGQISANMPTLAEGATQTQIADYTQQVNDLRTAGLQGANQLPMADKFSAGFESAKADPLQFAKNNMMTLGAAAGPIAADMMTPTVTKMPDISSNADIRQAIYDPYSGTYRRLNPVPAKNYGTPAWSPYKSAAAGGIVALAAGGMPGYAGGGDLSNIYKNLGGKDVYDKITADYLKAGGNEAGLPSIFSAYDKPVAAPAAVAAPVVAAPAAPNLNNIYANLGGKQVYDKIASDYIKAGGTEAGLPSILSQYDKPVAAPTAVAPPAGLTADQKAALDLMYKSSTTGVATSALDALGGNKTVKSLAESAGYTGTPTWMSDYEQTMGYQPSASTVTNTKLATDNLPGLYASLGGGDVTKGKAAYDKIAADYTKAGGNAANLPSLLYDETAGTFYNPERLSTNSKFKANELGYSESDLNSYINSDAAKTISKFTGKPVTAESYIQDTLASGRQFATMSGLFSPEEIAKMSDKQLLAANELFTQGGGSRKINGYTQQDVDFIRNEADNYGGLLWSPNFQAIGSKGEVIGRQADEAAGIYGTYDKAAADTTAADKVATDTTGTIGSQVTSNGIVDLQTDTGVKQDKTDTTTTGINQLATTKPADIKSTITTDGTYTGTSGTPPTMGTLFGQGKFVGTGTEMGTGTTGPIVDYGGKTAFGDTSPLTFAQKQIAEKSAAKNAADKAKLDLYRQWGTLNPKATNLEHANFVDTIGLDPAVAAQLIGISADQAQSAYNDAKYNKQTGDSLAAYRYLMGQGAYPTKSGVGEIMRPYSEATLGIPANTNKKYVFDQATGKYNLNPDYVAEYKDPSGGTNYLMSQKEILNYFKANAGQDDATTYAWAVENNLTPQEISQATGVPISQIAPKWRAAVAGAAAKKAVTNADGTVDETKLAAQKEANFDYNAYLKANPDVQAELDSGKANYGDKSDLAAAAWAHYARYGQAEGRAYTKKAAGGGMMGYAMGGYAVGGGLGSLGSYSDGGRLLRGPGDGVSDSIPATIGRKQQPARLADGEFVVPARIVSELGNGSTDAGAKKLYAMMDRVQRARGKTTGKNKVAANSRADKYLPA